MEAYKFTSHPVANPKAIVSGTNYRLTVLTEGIIRYEWAPDGHFEDRASTFAINRDQPVPNFTVTESDDVLEITTTRFHLTYDRRAFSPSGFLVELRGKFNYWETQWRFGDSDKSLGGTARTLDNVDGRVDLGPGVVAKHGFAAIDDSNSMIFDGQGWVSSRRPGNRVDGYLFAYGRDYKAAVQALYALSGRQPVLPRWSLGNWWSRYHAYSEEEYIALMDRFMSQGIPLTVAVLDMDWHLVDDDRVTTAGWTGYTWDRKLFPDPKAFHNEMSKRRLKVTLNDHPAGGLHAFEDQYEEMAAALGHDTKNQAPIQFDPSNPQYMKAYFEILHRNLEKEACDFWWIDWQQGPHSRTPGIDPLWLLNHYHYLDNSLSAQRPLIFSRYAGPGSHRYPIGFSGDTVVSWESLDFQPEFTATASNIGYGWWSHDIGGHMFGGRDDELVTRWVQLGVFSPIMRLHSSNSRWQSKEPWLYRAEPQAVMTRFLQLRHRLIPYLHSMNIRAASENEPLVQPMYWAYAALEQAYTVPNQYNFGSELIVSPVTKPRHKSTNLSSAQTWFPPGAARYVDIFTGLVYDGGRELEIFRPLNEMPVFARQGSIIPLDAATIPENGGQNPKAFEVLIVVGQDGRFEMLESAEDDATSTGTAVRGPETRSFVIEWDQQGSKLTVTSSVNDRSWTFRFVSLDTGIASNDMSISLNGEKIDRPVVGRQNGLWPKGLNVSIPAGAGSRREGGQMEISIQFSSQDLQLAAFDLEPRVEQLLLDYQIHFAVKDSIWSAAVAKKASLASRVGELISLGLDHQVVGPILELLLADSRQ